MKGIILLFKFMTRLPIPFEVEFDQVELGKSMKFFPLVGIKIGVLLYLSFLVGKEFIPSPLILATLLTLMEIAITGGIHLDGLSDTFDGIFSYRSKQKMLDIMKDSRIGANGAIALIMYFILKISLLAGLGEAMGVGLLISPVIARANSVLNCQVAPYAKSAGSAKEFVNQMTRQGCFGAILGSAVFSLVVQVLLIPSLNPVFLVNTIFVVHVLGAYFAKLMERKIGGITGDTLGAILELSQLLALLGLYIAKGI